MQRKTKKMKNIFTILIADKNSNVLSFLKRELGEEGYRILTANDIRSLVVTINNYGRPDLVIIDPVLPGVRACTLVKELKKENPDLPIIVHAYLSDFYDRPKVIQGVFFIEKEGASIESMKNVISDLINNREEP